MLPGLFGLMRRTTTRWYCSGAQISGSGHDDADKQLASRRGVGTSASPVNREGEAEVDKAAEDVRTLWIDVDGQQERHKEWRAVVQESYVERYHDCPLEGPDTVLHLLKRMLRFGERRGEGLPRGWLEMWCRERHVDGKDRTYHELETLTEVIMLGGRCVRGLHQNDSSQFDQTV